MKKLLVFILFCFVAVCFLSRTDFSSLASGGDYGCFNTQQGELVYTVQGESIYVSDSYVPSATAEFAVFSKKDLNLNAILFRFGAVVLSRQNIDGRDVYYCATPKLGRFNFIGKMPVNLQIIENSNNYIVCNAIYQASF